MQKVIPNKTKGGKKLGAPNFAASDMQGCSSEVPGCDRQQCPQHNDAAATPSECHTPLHSRHRAAD